MRVKGASVRTRVDFVRERFGPEAPAKLLEALSEADRRVIETVLPGSWIPFSVATRVDEMIAEVFADGAIEVCRDIGAFSASKNLATVYKIFVEQSGGDPQRLMENLSTLHGNLYDWGWMRAVPVSERLCRVESDYEGGANRVNCLTAVGFYGEALGRLEIGAEVREVACQVWSAPLCAYEVSWQARKP